jgi:phosphoribosylaminoimidazole carboxylase (NCAIR synthetase)
MKEALRAADVPCAQSRGVSSPHELAEFVSEVGYPIILKPRSAAGASGTKRVENDRELQSAMVEYGIDRGASVAAEEFIEGHEGFYDTISINGRVACDFASHYYPGVLEAMRTRWVSPQIVCTNRIGAAGYDEVKKMGQTVIDVLGIGTSATHMEWFFGPKGLKFSEIGCRPPGVGMWDVYAAANEFDIYREWAMAIVHGRIAQPPSRKYSCGMINLRPNQDGRIMAYQGWDQIERAYGEWIVDYHFQPVGSAAQPIEGGYMANSWVRMKHPDYDQLRRMLDQAGRTVKVVAG